MLIPILSLQCRLYSISKITEFFLDSLLEKMNKVRLVNEKICKKNSLSSFEDLSMTLIKKKSHEVCSKAEKTILSKV